MSTKFSGNSGIFSLILITKLIMSLRKTGTLSFLSEKSPAGEIKFKEGKITHAAYNNTKGEEALKLLLNSTGNFEFIEQNISGKITLLEEDAIKILNEEFNEWTCLQEITKIIPLNEVKFSILPITIDSNKENIAFTKEEWIVMSHINGNPLFADLFKQTKLKGSQTGKILLNLYKNDYIEIYTEEAIKDIKDILVLKGELSEFPLKNIISLLHNANITGNLKINSNGNQADMYIENQIIYNVKSTHWTGEMALAEISTWKNGTFSFYKFIRQEKTTDSINIKSEQLINNSLPNIDRLTDIIRTFKTPSIIFKINEEIESDTEDEEVLFNNADWNLMLHIDGIKTLRDLAQEINVSISELADKFYHLYKYELIGIVTEKEENSKQKNSDDLISLLYQEDKMNSEYIEDLKKTILFEDSEYDDNLISILNTKEKSIIDDTEEEDLLSLLNQEEEGDKEGLKKSILEDTEEEDLLSLLNQEEEGDKEGLKKSILEDTEEEDLLSLLNQEEEGDKEGLMKSILEDTEEEDLLSLLNQEEEGDKEGLMKSILEDTEEEDLLSLLNQEEEGDKEGLMKSILEDTGEEDLLSLLNQEEEGDKEGLKKSILEDTEEEDLLSLLNLEEEGDKEGLKKSILEDTGEEDLLSLLNLEEEGDKEGLKKSILEDMEEEDLLSLLNQEEDMKNSKKSMLFQKESEKKEK